MRNGCVANEGFPDELQICSQSAIKYYPGGVDENSFCVDNAGTWFKTGELSPRNENGIIWILGRIKSRIERAGLPITPAALESCIEGFTGFQECMDGARLTLGRILQPGIP